MYWNALFMLLLPVLMGYGIVSLRRGGWVRVPGVVVWGLVLVAVGFGVGRNFV
jgi:hypothetical protein